MNFLLVISLLTINFEVLPLGEYQPLLLLTIGVLLLVFRGRIGRNQLICSALMLMVALVSTLSSPDGNVTDVFRVAIASVFMLCGNLIIKKINKRVVYAIVAAHMVVLISGLIVPGVTGKFLSIFFPRGAAYYDGYNSFFATEPSYASINYFGLYVIYRIAGALDGTYKHNNWLDLFFILPLLFTKSITGIGFSAIMIIFNIIENRDWIFRHKKQLFLSGFALLILLVVRGDGNSVDGEAAESFARLKSFINFIFIMDDGSLLLLWTIAEPASSARFISNMSALVEGWGSLTGNGTFSISGPNFSDYPRWLEDMFNTSLIIQPGINGQTPLFNLIGHSGWLSIIPITFMVYFFTSGMRNFKSGSTRFLVLIYVLIGLLWQSAFVAPLIWIIISTVVGLQGRPRSLEPKVAGSGLGG